MGPEPILTSRTQPCPACGGAVRHDADWCTLCYADLRPAPVVVPPPPVLQPALTIPAQASYGLPAPDPLSDPLLSLFPTTAPPPRPAGAHAAPEEPEPEPTWPCVRCGTSNELTATLCQHCGGGFLATESSRPKLVVPYLGDLGAMSRSTRAAVAVGVLLVVLLPVLLLTKLTGHLENGSSSSPSVAPTAVSVPLPSGIPVDPTQVQTR